jgi:hypothetical protein
MGAMIKGNIMMKCLSIDIFDVERKPQVDELRMGIGAAMRSHFTSVAE